MAEIIQTYHEIISSAIDEEGISIPHALFVLPDDSLDMAALDLGPHQSYRYFLNRIRETNAKEAIFAMDRFTKEGQGTRLGDVMAGTYYVLDEHPFVDRFRPFIIEYQHDPRIVDPIVWDNEFWNQALLGELRKLV